MISELNVLLDWISKHKDDKKLTELLRFSILAESKFNNDLANVIANSNIAHLCKNSSKIFGQFSTQTSEILLTLGVPAYHVLGDMKSPKEADISEMDKAKATKKLFDKKQPSELYEFYIRKCLLLRALCDSNSINDTHIRIAQRCRNIGYATYYLIVKCEHRLL